MNQKGFTLIELLVAIAIIGILSSVILVYTTSTRINARNSKRYSDLRQINVAMELCYQDSGCAGGSDRYPDIPGGYNNVTAIGLFMPTLPKDPTNEGQYRYYWTSNNGNITGGAKRNQYYCLYARKETGNERTFVCSSNRGIKEKTRPFSCTPSNSPCNADCCGMSL